MRLIKSVFIMRGVLCDLRRCALSTLAMLGCALVLMGAPRGDWFGAEPEETFLIEVALGEDAEAVAAALGAVYVRPLENVPGFHKVAFLRSFAAVVASEEERLMQRADMERDLVRHSAVLHAEFNERLELFPRRFQPSDPLFARQWHLENTGQRGGLPGSDLRVRPAWDSGATGVGVVVGIVDTGTDYRHPDLQPNWLPGSGRDFIRNTNEPFPAGVSDRHGTAVTGIVAAASNTIGGLGIAYHAQFVPMRLISERDNSEAANSGSVAEALVHRFQEIDIYNNSWGPAEGGYRGISSTVVSALRNGVNNGRGGLGNIYVWAAGNGGLANDNSNLDGYNALPYTISVGALGDDDIRAGYSEKGANLLVVAPSQGRGAGITTTDNRGSSGYAPGDYFDGFNGTSAAAPMVAGTVALMLQTRPDLNWREVQQILAKTAVPVDFVGSDWQRNGAGHWFSHEYGFGRVDASAAVDLARQWQPVVPASNWLSPRRTVARNLPSGQTLQSTIEVSENLQIESIQVTLEMNFSYWGDLQVELVSPSGSRSLLVEPYMGADRFSSPGTWTYLALAHLNEFSAGTWTLRVSHRGVTGSGSWTAWQLRVNGRPAEADATGLQVDDIIVRSSAFPIVIDVLDGVADAHGNDLQILSVQAPRFGEIEESAHGVFHYSMGISDNGVDSFSVLLTDGAGRVARRIVEVRDPRPIARPDVFTVRPGLENVLDVLHNDLVPDGDPLRITAISQVSNGQIAIDADQRLIYRAPNGFTGIERVRYTITDDVNGNATSFATIIVQPSPDVAMDFDGRDDFLELAAADTAALLRNRFTTEAWIYARTYGEYVTGFGRIMDNRTFVWFINGFDHSFYNDASMVVFLQLEGGDTVAINSPEGTIELNRWHHVAVQFDSGNRLQPVRFFIDGQPVGVSYPLENSSEPRMPILNSAFPLLMGESDSGQRAFNGKITEARIWNRLLTPSEIAHYHERRLRGDEVGLVLYFPFDDTDIAVSRSRASEAVFAQIVGPQRVPRISPWNAFLEHFSVVDRVSHDGWWEDELFGPVFGDAYPWVYWQRLGWIYAVQQASLVGIPNMSTDPQFVFFSPKYSPYGWISTSLAAFPWFFQFSSGKWWFVAY